MIKKAVILAGGKGKRIANPDIPKSMIRINGKPVLENIFSILNKCGIEEAFLIVHYLKEQIINYFGSEFLGIKITYLDDGEILNLKGPVGIADVLSVMDERINESFLMILGDEVYYGTDHVNLLKSFSDEYEAMIGVMIVNDEELIKKNYTLRINDSFEVIDLEEKPEVPWNNILGCGTYIFKPSVFKHIRNTPVSEKSGKKEITDTLRVIAKSGILKAYYLGGKYLNINYKEDVKKAEEIFLNSD